MSAPPTTHGEYLRDLILSRRKPLRLSTQMLAEIIANSDGSDASVVHELVGLLIDHPSAAF